MLGKARQLYGHFQRFLLCLVVLWQGSVYLEVKEIDGLSSASI